MNKITLLALSTWLTLVGSAYAQIVYVDAQKGKDQAQGTLTDPLASLEKAVALASDLPGQQPVRIKIYPGVYTLHHQLDIKTRNAVADTVLYSLEAAILPDDPDWQPHKMPVIQSVSGDNSITQFSHSVGLLVAKHNVQIRGLKFLGNANPTVRYYYPITRENETYQHLAISQCLFIGDKNSAPIQAAIWAHGAATSVDHCIFYNCKNALILLKGIKNFSLKHSIIAGAYESAAWYNASDLTFTHNLVTNCNFVWLRPENTAPTYTFNQSVITNNTNSMGFYTTKGLLATQDNKHREEGIKKEGTVLLTETKGDGLPIEFLHPTAQSAGYELKAGLFKK